MGDVGKFIVGAALTVAGIVFAGPTGGASLALTAYGAGMLSRTLFPIKGIDRDVHDNRQTIASPVAPLPVVYGAMKVGCALVDIRPTGSDNKDLYIVAAICHSSTGEQNIEAVDEIYFDDKIAFNAAGTATSSFSSYATVTKYLGGQTSVPGAMSIFSAWTPRHVGRGVAYLVFKLTYNPDLYASIPRITCKVRGAKVVDPRAPTAAPAYTVNPALHVLDYLVNPVYGAGVGRHYDGLTSTAQVTVTGTGFTVVSLSGLIDDDPQSQGVGVVGATAGDQISFDMGRAVDLVRLDVSKFGEFGGDEVWKVRYSDNGTAWTDVPGGTLATTKAQVRNHYHWASAGSHRYWAMTIVTPASGGTNNLSGVRWYESEIDYGSFATMANVCDTAVSQPPADSAFKNVSGASTATATGAVIRFTITSHGWTTGDRVVVDLRNDFTGGVYSGVFSLDTSYYVEGNTYTITVVDSNTISLNGTQWSGTAGSANALRIGKLVSVAQYQGNGFLATDRPIADNVQALLSTFRGRLVYQNGKFRLHSHEASGGFGTIKDENVRSVNYTVPGAADKYNKVEVRWINPEKEYNIEQRVWPRVRLTSQNSYNPYLAADNYNESVLAVELPFCQNGYQAERVGQVLLKESRAGLIVQAVMDETGWLYEVGDIPQLQLSTPGFNIPVWVEAVQLNPDGLPILTLTQADGDAYTYTDQVPVTEPPISTLPDPLLVPSAPTGLVLTAGDAEIIVEPNGEWTQRIRVGWTESVSAYIDYTEIEAKKTAESTWDSWGRVPRGTTEFFIAPVTTGESWDVRIRAVTTLGRASTWVSTSIVPAPISKPWPNGVLDAFDSLDNWYASNAPNTSTQFVTIVPMPDSRYGGKVFQFAPTSTSVGLVAYGHDVLIPFEKSTVYHLLSRVRYVAGNAAPTSAVNYKTGFIAYDRDLNRLSIEGESGAGGNDPAGTGQFTTTSLSWTEKRIYLRGVNGGVIYPAQAGGGTVTNNGLSNFSSSNLADQNLSTKAFDVDTATANANFVVDFGTASPGPLALCGVEVYMNASGSTANFKVQWSDNGTAWTDASTTFTPSLSGWNRVRWAQSSRRRYWRLLLTNTPGAGPDVYEVWFYYLAKISGDPGYNNYDDPNAPGGFPPGTMYIRPQFEFAFGSATGTAQIDVIAWSPTANKPDAADPTVVTASSLVRDGVTNDRAVLQRYIDKLPTWNGKLVIPPGKYNLGSNTSTADIYILSFSGKYNVEVDARGAEFVFATSGTATILPRLVHHADVNGFRWTGGRFTDTGSDITVDWKGMDTFYLWGATTASVGDVAIRDVYVKGAVSLATIGASTASPRLRNFDIRGVAEDCYYGIVAQENGDVLRFDLLAKNVRRAFFAYGITDFDGRVRLEQTVASPGSNGAVVIKRYGNDTKSGRVYAVYSAASTATAHSALFRIEHQPTTGTGQIINLDLTANYEDVGAPNAITPFYFNSLTSGGTEETSTTGNLTSGITLRGHLGAWTNGNPIRLNVTQNAEGTMVLDPSLDPWFGLGINRFHFPGFIIKNGSGRYVRTFIGNLTTATYQFSLANIDSQAFALRARIYLHDNYASLAVQNAYYREDILFGYNASGGAVGVLSANNLHAVAQGTGPTSVTWGGSGENLTLVIAGATYNGSNAYMRVELEAIRGYP